jgi:hypothetical protein
MLRRYSQANKRNAISQQTRANVLATIDELNQYLEGNVTLEAATDATKFVIIAASW